MTLYKRNLQGMKELLNAIYPKITEMDWDGLYIIVGDEGVSKSNLGLWMAHLWLMKLYGKVDPAQIENIGLDQESFKKALKNVKQYEYISHDEAGDISSRRSMSQYNVLLTQAYMMIRGLNLLSTLILPDLWYLESYFVKHRAKGLFHVYKRGAYRFYGRKAIRRIVELNQNKTVKRLTRAKPLFTDTFKEYDGPLAEVYKVKKAEKINALRENIFDTAPHITDTMVAEHMGASVRHIGRLRKKWSQVTD